MQEQIFRIEDKIDAVSADLKIQAVQMAQVLERLTKINEVETDMKAHIAQTEKELSPIKHHVRIVGYVLRSALWLLAASLTTAIGYAFSLFAK